jgi:hypothetical protein
MALAALLLLANLSLYGKDALRIDPNGNVGIANTMTAQSNPDVKNGDQVILKGNNITIPKNFQWPVGCDLKDSKCPVMALPFGYAASLSSSQRQGLPLRVAVHWAVKLSRKIHSTLVTKERVP